MNKKKIGPNPLLMPMPVVIIGARVNNKPSFVMVTGCNVTLRKPLSFAVPLEKDTYVLEGIDKYGVFSMNVPPSDLI